MSKQDNSCTNKFVSVVRVASPDKRSGRVGFCLFVIFRFVCFGVCFVLLFVVVVIGKVREFVDKWQHFLVVLHSHTNISGETEHQHNQQFV